MARSFVENLILALLTAAVIFAGVAIWSKSRKRTDPTAAQPAPKIAWVFEAVERGAIVAAPVLDDNRVYISATHFRGGVRAGAVYAIDNHTGQQLWRFDADATMLPTASTPCLADGRLYVGEGMHANFVCRFFCLDAATGTKLWEFRTDGHIESSPCVASGLVYFGSGDDGLFALDAVNGTERWHFREDLHIDSSPAVQNDRVYVGSGVSRLHRRTEVLCFEAVNGRVLWRRQTDLPVWGSPAVTDAAVFAGLGNGRLTESAAAPDLPAGALLELDLSDGRLRRRFDAGDAVMMRPTLDGAKVYFASRSGAVQAIERYSGQVVWSTIFNGPVVASPTPFGDRVYVAADGGLWCLAAFDGKEVWHVDLTRYAPSVSLFSAPAVTAASTPGGRRIFLAGQFQNGDSSAAALYCFEE